MLTPGYHYVNTIVRVAANFQDDAGTDIDPDSVVLKTYSPSAVETTYTVADGDVIRIDAGDYYVDIQPDESGRWFWRWETTGAGKTIAMEGSFVVRASVFFDDLARDAYRR